MRLNFLYRPRRKTILNLKLKTARTVFTTPLEQPTLCCQVRAMLSQLAKSPVCGDLRYGASGPLPDQSVALHARSLFLPTVDLGDTDMKTMRFVAPIPKTWTQFFSLKEAKIPKINYEGKQSNNSTAVTERTDTASYPTTD